MEFLNSIFSWVIKKRMHDIALFKKYPLEVQDELLKSLIKQGGSTAYGKQYNFNKISSLQEFRSAVPVVSYEDIVDLIIRNKQGEQQIFWPSEIKWYAKSSGTTNDKSKFIPLSKEALQECHYKGGKDMLSIYYSGTKSARLFSGKSLIVGGTHEMNQFSSDSFYGDLSAIIIENLPFWVEYKRVPERSIALMSKWEDKLEKMALSTIEENITNISGVPSWTMVLLKKVLEITGQDHIHQVWPELELYMHGGVNFSPYRSEFNQLLPEANMHYMETYNASEGFFGIQDRMDHQDMLLMLDYGVYYEFAPQEEWSKPQPETLSLSEVELDTDYEMIITTNAGLWRYRLGDTIRFTSRNPFRIQVSGRTKQFINVFGEELMVHNAEQALEVACKTSGAIIKEFTVAPVVHKGAHEGLHQWAIEWVKSPNDMAAFGRVLDESLQQLNSDYQAKRAGILQAPQLISLPSNTFYDWMKRRGKLGGQHKVPRLSTSRKYMDELLNETLHRAV